MPRSGNPTMPPAVATAKEIRELINAKAGINDLDVSDCFDEEEEDEDLLDVSRPPQQITVASEAAVITQMTQLEGEPLNNQQQQDSTVTQRDRRASAARVTFHVESTFATGKVCCLQLKHFRESFLHRYACFSRRTYVAVFGKKQLRQCEARKVRASQSTYFR
jgi:hypothetical protein